MSPQSSDWKTNIKNWITSMLVDLSWGSLAPTGIEKRRFSIFEWERGSSSESDASNVKTRVCYTILRMTHFLLCFAAKSFTFYDKTHHEKRYYYNYLTFWTCWTQLIYAFVFLLYVVFTSWKYRNFCQCFSSTHGTSTSRCRTAVSTPNSTNQTPAAVSEMPLLEPQRQHTTGTGTGTGTVVNRGDSEQTNRIKWPSVESVIWVLFHIQLNLSIFVTILFSIGYSKELSGKTFINHGANAILALLDLFFVALPVRFPQVVYPALFALLYTVYSIIWAWAVGGGGYPKEGKPYVYHVLNWIEKPGFAIGTTLVSLIIIIVFQFGLWALKWGFKHKLLPFLCRCQCPCRRSNRPENQAQIREGDHQL